MFVQQAFQMEPVRQYINPCSFVAKQAFQSNCLPLVALKHFQMIIAKHKSFRLLKH